MASREDWRSALNDAEELTPDAVALLLETHGDRGRRAIDAISEARVKQYLDFTIVVGHQDEYIVEAGECTCKDSEYNLDADDPDQRCWHSLAVEIAEQIGAIEDHDLWYAEVRDLI